MLERSEYTETSLTLSAFSISSPAWRSEKERKKERETETEREREREREREIEREENTSPLSHSNTPSFSVTHLV
jgi:hypothetical protein